MLKWDNKFSVRIKSIDEQHKKLIDIYNTFSKHVAEKKEITAITQASDALMAYAKEHFHFEEEMLRDFGWSNLDNHKALHGKLIDDIVNFKIELKMNPRHQLLVDFKEFLKNWLRDHILVEDKKYALFMADKQFD